VSQAPVSKGEGGAFQISFFKTLSRANRAGFPFRPWETACTPSEGREGMILSFDVRSQMSGAVCSCPLHSVRLRAEPRLKV